MLFVFGVLDYIFVDDDTVRWYRFLWHEYYADCGRIDNICVGSSHVYSDINPAQMDYLTGEYNFNLSSAMQSLNGSYYLIRQASEDNHLSHVYLELYYLCSTKDNFNDNLDPICLQLDKNWNNTDYMNWTINKLRYMSTIGSIEDCPTVWIPFIRYRDKLGDWEYIKNVVETKEKESYKQYVYEYDYSDGNGYTKFLDQAYFYSTREYYEKDRIKKQERILSQNPIGELSESYLRDILLYCKKEKLPITLFISPIDNLELISTEGYDNYITQIRSIAEEYGVDFYDFNLAKEEYLPVWENENFRDEGHLNNKGASIFTPFFYKVIEGNKGQNEKYFYSSYDEKLQYASPTIYGLYFRDAESENTVTNDFGKLRNYTIASNRNTEMEYRVVLIPNESQRYVLQEFCYNKEFVLPQNEHGVCIIESKMKNSENVLQRLEVNY